jgi:glycosyltransferase involved in cell wall biosynthesis
MSSSSSPFGSTSRITPLVSIITPTYQRPASLQRLHHLLLDQHLPPNLAAAALVAPSGQKAGQKEGTPERNWEWLIFDDSPTPCAPLLAQAGPHLRYFHATDRFTVGEKRNILVEAARGEIIAHFDDDDFYRADYLARMVSVLLQAPDVGLVKLEGWHLWSKPDQMLGYWDTTCQGGPHFRISRRPLETVRLPEDPESVMANRLGFGFSYVYRRSLWERNRFLPLAAGEDTPFAAFAAGQGMFKAIADREGICLHILHRSNSSLCFPQYRLPEWELERLFGPRIRSFLSATDA